MTILNWCWIPFALAFASPILARCFPASPDSVMVTGVSTEIPDAARFLAKVCICFLIDDVSFYCYHRVLHSNRVLYERFHKPHHVFTAPFAWTSHAVHPVEMLLQSVGTMTGPLLLRMTLTELWCWLALRQWHGVLDHTGYDLPFLDTGCGWLPGIFGGTAFHDDHHRFYNGNYASYFSFIDDLLGTRVRNREGARRMRKEGSPPTSGDLTWATWWAAFWPSFE